MSFEPLPRIMVGRKEITTITLQSSGTIYISTHLIDLLGLRKYKAIAFYVDNNTKEIALRLKENNPTGEWSPIRYGSKRGAIVSSKAFIDKAREFGYPLNKRLDYILDNSGLIVILKPHSEGA